MITFFSTISFFSSPAVAGNHLSTLCSLTLLSRALCRFAGNHFIYCSVTGTNCWEVTSVHLVSPANVQLMYWWRTRLITQESEKCYLVAVQTIVQVVHYEMTLEVASCYLMSERRKRKRTDKVTTDQNTVAGTMADASLWLHFLLFLWVAH